MTQQNEILTSMNKNWIYETIVTTKDADGKIRAAPIGISTPEFEHVILEVYKTSKTSENIVREKKFIINFVMYAELFWKAVIHKHLDFDDLGHLMDSDVWLEMEVKEVESQDDKIKIYSKISNYKIKNQNFVLINRAKHLAFESIIRFTKPDLLKAKKEISENLRAIKKVAPGSKYERIVEEILNKIEKKNK